MARHYKAITDHVPIDYGADLQAIETYVAGLRKVLTALFERWNLRTLEPDDCAALIEQLRRRLIAFALDCNALPLRTPRQLIGTVRLIARKPQAFLADVGRYDPEAVARVYGAYASVSGENHARLESFEWGTGPAPPAQEIAQAAARVVGDLEKELQTTSRVGGQTLVLQHELVRDLARMFENFGGRIRRVTRVDLATGAYTEDGSFYAFLEIVVPPARPFARKAGFRMRSIRSLIAILQKSGDRTRS